MNRFFGLFFFWAFGLGLSAQTLEVCSSCEWTSITAAVKAAQDGDTVLIKKGIYRENEIEIRKSITMLGQNWPVIDGMGENEILIVFADKVKLKGLQLQNVGVSFMKDRAAIRLVQCRDVVVEGNKLHNTFFGIYLQKAADCIIRNNEIIGEASEEFSAGNAIHIWKATNILIEGNTAKKHRDGIYFEFVDSSRIINNLSEGNLRYGLHFMFSNQDVYSKNTFRNNGVGVAVMFSKNIEMIRNVFEDNWGSAAYGILLKEISDGAMIQNRFQNNTRGIYAEGTNRLQIRENDFIENGWALDIKGNCDNNLIENNNFIGNTFEVITNSKQNGNLFRANYWSHYRGYDLNRDGYGDVPHRPVSLFAMLSHEIPAASMFLHSFLERLMEYSEKVLPTLTPDKLIDNQPLMKPFQHD